EILDQGNIRQSAYLAIVAAKRDPTQPLPALLAKVNALMPTTLSSITVDGGVESLAFNSREDLLAIVGKMGKIIVVSIPSFQPIQQTTCSLAGVATFSEDGERLAVGCEKTITLLEVPSLRLVDRLTTDTNVSGIKFAPDGRILAAQCGKTLVVYEVATGRAL